MILSDNYRGIYLCSSILKLINIIMLNKSGAKLKTSDLQFAYEAGMSTATCSTVLKEVVQYYKSNGSPVYGCVLDASKAFDRIKYDKLFEILLERHFPVIYISLQTDSYINQNISMQWGNSVSEAFNGVSSV